MDIITRKYRFIEEFIKIINSEKADKLALLEEILHAGETPQDEDDFSITEDQKKELDSIRNRHLSGEGESFTLDEIRQKFKDWNGV